MNTGEAIEKHEHGKKVERHDRRRSRCAAN
jgi:hypothetical protein